MTVAVLGAQGRFGRAAMAAFNQAGWPVRALARQWRHDLPDAAIEKVTVDAFDREKLSCALKDCCIIVNALNPPYPKWQRDLPRLTANVINAAKASGAAVMIPGNVYNYGADMPVILNEATPHRAVDKKGRLRIDMEQAYRTAGIRTVVVRGGDFIDGAKTGNWFDSHITRGLMRGRVLYPGPLDRVHAWAYLPDMARAMAALAAHLDRFSIFEDIGFPGYALTGAELIAALEHACGRRLQHRSMPWPLVKAAGVFSPMLREVAEMAYLWRIAHRIDGCKLTSILPHFTATPVDQAMAEVLPALFPQRDFNRAEGPRISVARSAATGQPAGYRFR